MWHRHQKPLTHCLLFVVGHTAVAVVVPLFLLLLSVLPTPGQADILDGGLGSSLDMEETAVPPRFLSRGQTFRAVIGDTVVLPCEVEQLGGWVLLWRRGSAVLTAGDLKVTRDRHFRLLPGHSLQVVDVAPQHAGDYTCQIADTGGRDLVHTLEIMVPPSVRPSPAGGRITARKGSSVTLECRASGNPVPIVHWSRKDGQPLSRGRDGQQLTREGFTITLDRLDRQHGGVYQCTADNGVGDPVTVDMQLDVLYPPEIQVERSWVHSGEGYEAKLDCIVFGDPPPQVSWYQNSFPLEATEKRLMEIRGNKHTLTIKHLQNSDFGNYSCVADNSLGRAKKYIEVSGRPGPAQFRSGPYGSAGSKLSRGSHNLTWVVHSYPPLEQVRLLYRKIHMNDTYQRPGEWHDVAVAPPIGGGGKDGAARTMSYNIRNLPPAAAFEAVVQAKNRYGWNEVSDLHQFFTRDFDAHMEDVELMPHSSAANGLLVSPIQFVVILVLCTLIER